MPAPVETKRIVLFTLPPVREINLVGAEETDELVAAVDEGIEAAEEGRVFSLDEIRSQMHSWITK